MLLSNVDMNPEDQNLNSSYIKLCLEHEASIIIFLYILFGVNEIKLKANSVTHNFYFKNVLILGNMIQSVRLHLVMHRSQSGVTPLTWLSILCIPGIMLFRTSSTWWSECNAFYRNRLLLLPFVFY